MLATHIDVEYRYTKIREYALKTVSNELSNTGLDFRLIDKNALIKSEKWKFSSKRYVNWDWFGTYGAFKFRHPKRFELALWQKNYLASLTLGRPTYHGKGLRLDFIEGNPESRNIIVFPIVMAAMVTYAKALGISELRIMNPINKDVKNVYQKYGLTYVSKYDYLFLKI